MRRSLGPTFNQINLLTIVGFRDVDFRLKLNNAIFRSEVWPVGAGTYFTLPSRKLQAEFHSEFKLEIEKGK